MKKIFFALLTITIAFTASAQVKRKKTTAPADSTAAAPAKSRGDKKEMMKELNLTRQQKIKIKEIKEEGKVKMDEIKNNAALSDNDKQARQKTLRAEQLKKTMAVLNEEQKEKLKQLRKNKKGEKSGDDSLMEED